MSLESPNVKKPVASAQEKKQSLSVEHLRSLAISAMTSSALLMSGPAHAEKYEHSPVLNAETLKVLKQIGLENIVKNKNIDVRIPRLSASGKYIVQLDVEHINRISDQRPDDQRETIEVQKQSYETIRTIVADLPYAAFYPEGISKEKGAATWEADKHAVQKFKIEIYHLSSEGNLNLENIKSAFTHILSDYRVANIMGSEIVHTLASTGLEALGKTKSDPKIINYLQGFAPLGKDTLYYYGGLKYAYEQGYVQNVKGCESLEELERINMLVQLGETEKIDHTKREKQLVDCLSNDLQASGDNFVVTTFGAGHDLVNQINTLDKAKNEDTGYIVLTPHALSWFVDSKKSR